MSKLCFGNQASARGDSESIGRLEAQRLWEANPCVAETVLNLKPESLEWFREARRVRYEEYAPWLIKATGIDEIRGKRVLEIVSASVQTILPLRKEETN